MLIALFYGFAEGVFMQQSCHKLLVFSNGLQSLGSYLPYQGVGLLHFDGKVCFVHLCGETTKVINILSAIAFVITDRRG